MNQGVKKEAKLPARVMDLLKKGVRMTAPFSVEIGDEVDPAKISKSLVIYGPARISGSNTFIAENVKLGFEAPVTLIDCQIGPDVELRGGYFAGSVFLDKATAGSGAQIRPGCLLEEETGLNHCVGLKQTILFPYVQLGSLINFCDCLMAGGTSRKNHSEVGSSYIHFNFTPRQDKATASLIGDVPRGVMLREPPIFLGGQGAMVGPVKIDFGTVIPAGVICRVDYPGGKTAMRLFSGEKKQKTAVQRKAISRKVQRNIEYIASVIALKQWYLHARRLFFSGVQEALHAGAVGVLNDAIAERVTQLDVLREKISESLAEGEKKHPVKSPSALFTSHWAAARDFLLRCEPESIGQKERDAFLLTLRSLADRGTSYLEAIQSLKTKQAETGSAWLASITDTITLECLKHLKYPVVKKRC
ncbi:MAG TPA: UDP-N-acetylglucosamine pyrophosphorylase [Smithella sp.]|nr:UDP-N-acetylglucosamine pyrophosphorylase [Smithella sp.]